MKRETAGEIGGHGKEQAGKLGVSKEQKDLIFRAALEDAREASLIIYRKGSDEIIHEIPLQDRHVMGDIYAVRMEHAKENEWEYNYRIGKKVVQDPYARVIRGRESFGETVENGNGHQIRCGFAFEPYDWGDDAPLKIPYEDAMMYGLHVRGFTMQANSRVRHKGTFRGVAEKAQYLAELGVNQVKLMPAYEFDEIVKLHPDMHMNYKELPGGEKSEKLNFWGYKEGWYFAPKHSYASGNNPVKEMKDMVRTLHRHGIEVLMEFYFTEDIDVRLAFDCLAYWVTEYHVDGFHILGNNSLAKLLARDPYFTETKILGAYFPAEDIYKHGKVPGYRNLGECNVGFMEDMRRLLKGDERQLEAFAYRNRRNSSRYGIVNYMAGHDGFTMMDMVSYEEKHNEANGEQNHDGPDLNLSWNCGVEGPTRKKKIVKLRQQQLRNAFLMLLLSSGTPMIQAGDEFGNSQDGNNNPYCLDNETSWVNWKAAKKNEELTAFVRDAAKFRKRHRILHMPYELKMMDTKSCGYPDISYHGTRAWYGGFENGTRAIGIMYCEEYAGDDGFLYAAYNLHWEEHEFALPNLPEGMKWYVAVDSAKGVYPQGEEAAYTGDKMYPVPARTIIVLVGRRE